MNKIISIRWDGTQYRVDRPNWDGGEVVPLEDVRALIEALRINRAALQALAHDGVPGNWLAWQESEEALAKVVSQLGSFL